MAGITELSRVGIRIRRPKRQGGSRRMPHHLVVENYWAFAFLALSLIGLFGLTLLPIIVSFGLSFTDWDALGSPNFVGLRNFVQLVHDPTFFRALWNTIYYTLVSVPLGVSISLALALVLNRSLPGMGLLRTLFLIPMISSTVATALLWGLMLDPYIGLINFILQLLHLPTSGWLTDVHMAMPAIIIMTVWRGLGYNMVLFLAGLQGVPQELREAARIDGANRLQEFANVTVPMISPTTFFILVISIITSFQVFDQTWVLTKGGPQEATTTLVYYVYQTGFQNLRMGYASAIAYALFFLTLIVVMIQWVTQKRWVFYQ
jgi:multiple sugar transport system permease protein